MAIQRASQRKSIKSVKNIKNVKTKNVKTKSAKTKSAKTKSASGLCVQAFFAKWWNVADVGTLLTQALAGDAAAKTAVARKLERATLTSKHTALRAHAEIREKVATRCGIPSFCYSLTCDFNHKVNSVSPLCADALIEKADKREVAMARRIIDSETCTESPHVRALALLRLEFAAAVYVMEVSLALNTAVTSSDAEVFASSNLSEAMSTHPSAALLGVF